MVVASGRQFWRLLSFFLSLPVFSLERSGHVSYSFEIYKMFYMRFVKRLFPSIQHALFTGIILGHGITDWFRIDFPWDCLKHDELKL